MKMIPLLRVGEMETALAFYTKTLDFVLWEEGASADDWVVNLRRGDAELMLTRLATDQAERVATNVLVEDVDALFRRWTNRGLDQSHRTESPVHLGPVDQTWGTREFYATDPFGNTLRIIQRSVAAPPSTDVGNQGGRA